MIIINVVINVEKMQMCREIKRVGKKIGTIGRFIFMHILKLHFNFNVSHFFYNLNSCLTCDHLHNVLCTMLYYYTLFIYKSLQNATKYNKLQLIGLYQNHTDYLPQFTENRIEKTQCGFGKCTVCENKVQLLN